MLAGVGHSPVNSAQTSVDELPAVDLNKPRPTSVNSPNERWPALMAPGMRSTNLEKTIDYYSKTLDMVVRGKVAIGDFTEIILAFEGKEDQPGLIFYKTKGAKNELTPVDHGDSESKVIIGVPDIALTSKRISEAGYTASEIIKNGAYQIIIAHDPDGYKLEIVQHP